MIKSRPPFGILQQVSNWFPACRLDSSNPFSSLKNWIDFLENSILIIAILLKTLQLLSVAFRLNSNLWTLYILSSTLPLALYLGNYTYLLFSENIIFLWKLYLIPCPKCGLKFPSAWSIYLMSCGQLSKCSEHLSHYIFCLFVHLFFQL